jgi:hypothetical protein
MLEACKISELRRSSEHHLFFHDCSECPEHTDLENTSEDVVTDIAIENITFKQWISTDRCELVTIVVSTKEFIESLLEKLLLLVCHSFIGTQQAMFLKELNLWFCATSLKILLSFCKMKHNGFTGTIHKPPFIHL